MQNRNLKLLTIFILLIVVVVFVIFSIRNKSNEATRAISLDNFAKCLAEKKITMYGAVWCSHCVDQKKMFGDSFSFVPYVECPDNPKICIDAGVNGYPTWIFPDGRKFPGVMKLVDLSKESECPLPENNL